MENLGSIKSDEEVTNDGKKEQSETVKIFHCLFGYHRSHLFTQLPTRLPNDTLIFKMLDIVCCIT